MIIIINLLSAISRWFNGALYINSDKTWVFDQSERAQGPIAIIMVFKCLPIPFFFTIKTLKELSADLFGVAKSTED